MRNKKLAMTEQNCRPTLLIFIAGHADCTIAQVLLTDGFPITNVQPLAERSQSIDIPWN